MIEKLLGVSVLCMPCGLESACTCYCHVELGLSLQDAVMVEKVQIFIIQSSGCRVSVCELITCFKLFNSQMGKMKFDLVVCKVTSLCCTVS